MEGWEGGWVEEGIGGNRGGQRHPDIVGSECGRARKERERWRDVQKFRTAVTVPFPYKSAGNPYTRTQEGNGCEIYGGNFGNIHLKRTGDRLKIPQQKPGALGLSCRR